MAAAAEIPEGLHELLRGVARQQRTIFYGEAAPVAGIEVDNPHFAAVLGRLLDEINHVEAEDGRPLLSVVVIGRESGMPGSGFFTCARRLKVHSGKDDLAFWVGELKRVHAYWSGR